jgi:RimJ/RimL family protein N-acetyltransferase
MEEHPMKEILRTYKHAPDNLISSYCVPIIVNGTIRGRLRPITLSSLHNRAEIQTLADWRRASGEWFTTQFPVTEDGTRDWLQHQVIEAEDRILFIVEDEEHTPIGQIGLIHYDENKKECEFDNLLRGKKGRLGNIIIYALIAIGAWSLRVLDIQKGYINVLADNFRAIEIYRRLGAQEVRRFQLNKVVEGDAIRWVPSEEQSNEKPEREMVTMMITREDFFNKTGYNMGAKEGGV